MYFPERVPHRLSLAHLIPVVREVRLVHLRNTVQSCFGGLIKFGSEPKKSRRSPAVVGDEGGEFGVEVGHGGGVAVPQNRCQEGAVVEGHFPKGGLGPDVVPNQGAVGAA